MKSSQTPELPSRCIWWSLPFQPLKSPTTLTPRACGAQTANDDAFGATDFRDVRAELFVDLFVTAFAEEMEVNIAEHRLKLALPGTGGHRGPPLQLFGDASKNLSAVAFFGAVARGFRH